MGIRGTGRKSLSLHSESIQLNRSYFTTSYRQCVSDGTDQEVIMGANQSRIRAIEIARLNRLNNFHFYDGSPPFLPMVIKFDL